MGALRKTLSGLAVAAALLVGGAVPAWAGSCGFNGSTLVCAPLRFVTVGFTPAEAAGIGAGGLVVGAAAVTLASRRRGRQLEHSGERAG